MVISSIQEHTSRRERDGRYSAVWDVTWDKVPMESKQGTGGHGLKSGGYVG
jgi:cation transport regulator ChaB